MLQKLRSLPNDTKKTLALLIAGFFCIIIFTFWIFSFLGILSQIKESSGKTGVAIFSFLDDNVNRAYNTFSNVFDKSQDVPLTDDEISDDSENNTSTSTSTDQLRK